MASLGLILGIYFAILIPSGAPWLRLLAPNLWLLAAGSVVARQWSRGISLTRGGRRTPLLASLSILVVALLIYAAAAWPPRPARAVTTAEALALITLVPLAEEFYFRGLLLDHLRRTTGGAMAAILVSGLFGLLHLPQDQHLSMAALSLVLCLVTLGSGSLIWAVALHAGWNAAAEMRTLPPGAGRWTIAAVAAALVLAIAVRGLLTRTGGSRTR